MSASWDSDLSSIIEQTNNNLKLLRKIGDKPQVRAPNVSVTTAGYSSARPRAFVGAQDDAGSASSRGMARPRAFVRGDDDMSSMDSHGSIRHRAYVRGDDDTGSVSSHSARPKAFLRSDDDSGSLSSRISVRPKAVIRSDDDAGSASSRASARPKAYVRTDDDSGSVSSRASARPKAFIRGDDDTGSMSSLSSARPKAFIRGDDSSYTDSGNPLSRSHIGIAGGGGLTSAMLQQHRAAASGGMVPNESGAQRARFDLDETRSMSGASVSRLRRSQGSSNRIPHAQPLGSSRIRVPDADIPSERSSHVVDELRKNLETHFAAHNNAMDKKVADLRTDVTSLTMQTSALSSQMAELRDAVVVSSRHVTSVSDSKILASVQANAAAINRLDEHSAAQLSHKASVDRELTDLGSRVKALSSATVKISSLEDNIEALVANRQKQEQGLFKLSDRVQLIHRQMGNFVDMKAVENLVSIRLTRELREMEDRLSQNMMRMAEKMEQKIHNVEKQSTFQRQESLATLRSDWTDDLQRVQSSSLRKSDLLPLQNAQTQSKEELAQLSNALDRQEKKLQDAKVANSALRDELADARTELSKALQTQQRRASALMEEKLEQITSENKDKILKIDEHLTDLAKKQKKLEDATKTLQITMEQVEAGDRLRSGSADQDAENGKLRQHLARSVAELEAMAVAKSEVERRFAREEQQFQTRLQELRTTMCEAEKQKEAQRLELMQKLQEESKLMGVAQGKNALLESLLAREKAESDEKKEMVRKSKKEVAEVREQLRKLESDKEKSVRQLSSDLQAKQTQIKLLTKTLDRVETASAQMLDLSKREAKSVRRAKATKEHELFLAQLKLKEMEQVALALQNGDEIKEQTPVFATSPEERKELQKLLLEIQLEKDELKQELREMTDELNAAQERQKMIMEDTFTKLSSDYNHKICELQQQISDRDQAIRQLRDTLVDKSSLDVLDNELAALKDEKNELLEQLQRAQIEHERVTLNIETDLRLEHATEFAAIRSKLEERILDLESLKSELGATKATIAELEEELKGQEALHQREVVNLGTEIKAARETIDECTAEILILKETKIRLEDEISQMEANFSDVSADKEEQFEAAKIQMQAKADELRAEIAEISSTLADKQTQLNAAKQSDETSRQRLVEMAMAQEEMQSRYISRIDTLTLELTQERENSCAREQELEETVNNLEADVKIIKAEAMKELESVRSDLADQMTELTTTLKASQHHEQQLQTRLKRILEELLQAVDASGEIEVAENAEMSDDEAITHHLDALYATHRRTVHDLERLQAEYELIVQQAAIDSATAKELDIQVKKHESQIKELEVVVEQLREELKEQHYKSAVLAKGSEEFSEEMASLREEKSQLELQLQEEEKDRAKREVSFQRKTEAKEREMEELRDENTTLTAAVAAVREKIHAVEQVKCHELDELEDKLKELEGRTAALQMDENNVANLEKDFTITRQEVATLSVEVQSLYQKLTACCGIIEWSELRASVYDGEEKLTRVRTEHAHELAKMQSVEQEVLTNAEFLNALLVAHVSTADNENDIQWMQKYVAVAPEIVEKLHRVELRLRDVLFDLHDSTLLKASAGNEDLADEVAARPPTSQKAAVDGSAMALALEKANEDYFSENSDTAQDLDGEDVKIEPDVEQESVVDHEAGARQDHVNVNYQDSIAANSHRESEIDFANELGVAEHVVHDEQGLSHEEQDSTIAAMSEVNDKLVALGLKELPRGLGVNETVLVKTQSNWSAADSRSGDGVERAMVEISSKQVKRQTDNECDDSDDSGTSILRVETEEKSLSALTVKEGKEVSVSVNSHNILSHTTENYAMHANRLGAIVDVVPAVDAELSVENLTLHPHSTLDKGTSKSNVGESSASVADDESKALQELLSSRKLPDVGGSRNCADDDFRANRSAIAPFPSEVLDSSFDAGSQSDQSDDANQHDEAELLSNSINFQEHESDEQLRAADNLTNANTVVDDDDKAGDDVGPSCALTMEIQVEEERMSVQAPVQSFSAALSRFNMGSRCLILEEDEEMDDVERLLSDERASTMQQRHQQSSQYIESGGGKDEKLVQFSLQSQCDTDGDEVGNDSIQFSKDNEVRNVSSIFEDNLVIRVAQNELLSLRMEKSTLVDHPEQVFALNNLSLTMANPALSNTDDKGNIINELTARFEDVEAKFCLENKVGERLDAESDQGSSAESDEGERLELSAASIRSGNESDEERTTMRMDSAEMKQFDACNSLEKNELDHVATDVLTYDIQKESFVNVASRDFLEGAEASTQYDKLTNVLDSGFVKAPLTPSVGDTALANESEDSALDESSSNGSIVSREKENKVPSRHGCSESDSDDIHSEISRSPEAPGRRKQLTSSFDADIQYEQDEMKSFIAEEVVNKLEDEWPDLRLEEAGDNVMEDDESSEEGNSDDVQAQVLIDTCRPKFEEDDEMDEIERLLLDQSASSVQQRYHQPSRSMMSDEGESDNEFDEASLRSLSDEDNDDDPSEALNEGNEGRDVTVVLVDNLQLERNKDLSRRVEISAFVNQREEDSALDKSLSTMRRTELTILANESSFHYEDKGRALERFHTGPNYDALTDFDRNDTLEESATHVTTSNEVDGEVLEKKIVEFEQSGAGSSFEAVPSAERFTEANEVGRVESSELTGLKEGEDSALEESATSVINDVTEEFKARSSTYAYDDSLALNGSDDDTGFNRGVEATALLNSLEGSFDADIQPDNDDGTRRRIDTEVFTQLFENREDNGLKRAAGSVMDAEMIPENDSEAGDKKTIPSFARMALRMEDDESSDEEEMISVQAEGSSISANLSRSGMSNRRLNLEEDDEMDEIERLLLDQSASSMGKRYRQPSRVIEDQLKRSSLQSQNDEDDDDMFEERSGQSSQDEEPRDLSTQSHQVDFGDTSLSLHADKGSISSQNSLFIKHRAVEAIEEPHNVRHEDIGRDSPRSKSHEMSELDEALRRLRDGDKIDETFPHPPFRAEDELSESINRSGSSDESDFGEISIPLEEEENLYALPRTRNMPEIEHPSRSPATPISHEGLMTSPARRKTSLGGQDSVNEIEHEYAEDSFDLEESLKDDDS